MSDATKPDTAVWRILTCVPNFNCISLVDISGINFLES